MSNSEDIKFLEQFREWVDEYLFLGYSPQVDPLIPTEGLRKLKGALEKTEFQELRRKINKNKPRAAQILDSCGCGGVLEQYPPPAIGGPVLRFPILDLIVENLTLRNIGKEFFFDKIDQAIGVLEAASEKDDQSAAPEPSVKITKGFVFIAMPMNESDPALEDVHEAIKEVATNCGLLAERVDDPESSERITDRVIDSLQKAEYVVADLTHARPNVYYEAGFGHAFGKTPIYIAREGTEIEFDLKDYPIIFFKNIKNLKKGLKSRFIGLGKNKA